MEDASPPGPTPTARRRPLTRRRGGLRAALSPANLLLAVLIIFLAWCYFGDKFILRKPIKYDEEAGYDDLDPLELHDRLNTNLGALHGAAEILLREKVLNSKNCARIAQVQPRLITTLRVRRSTERHFSGRPTRTFCVLVLVRRMLQLWGRT